MLKINVEVLFLMQQQGFVFCLLRLSGMIVTQNFWGNPYEQKKKKKSTNL